MRVLFVDDEPIVLRASERMVRTRHPSWQPASATSGEAALVELAARPYDVIVSDIGMPVMDGVTLLARVADEFPDVMRFALSGDARSDARLRAVGVVHQWFAKPCVLKELMNKLEYVVRAGSLVDASARRELVRLSCLPSPIATHALLAEAREGGHGVLEPIVAADPALSAKVLQLASSAFFGDFTATSSVAEGLRRIGLDRFWILLERGELATPSTEARTGGSLFTLVPGPDPISQARRSGFLLALWGLPEELVRAVTYQHDASSAPDPATSRAG